MEKIGVFPLRWLLLALNLCVAAIYIAQSDATKTIHHHYRVRKHFKSSSKTKWPRTFHALRKYDMNFPLDISKVDPYVSSPFSSSPYDALPPFSLPDNTPPFCVYPPNIPRPPSTNPNPIGGYTPLPPPGPILSPPFSPNPASPQITPIPISPIIFPNPPSIFPNPPSIVPSPPYNEPSPPYSIPSPTRSIPSPGFLPPIVFPPPMVPPPPRRIPATAMWCVAKASVPDPIIQEAMNYACGSGADCDQIQPNGLCFQPNTFFAHASYAFNSYWQRTKMAGATCDFGGTAILVTVDPSYDGCHFLYF